MEIICIIAIIVLLLLVAFLFCMSLAERKRLRALEKRYNRFMRGKDISNMEEVILNRFAEIAQMKKSMRTLGDSLSEIDEMAQVSYQKLGLVKYDAFDEMGGNLSFALALLNKKNNGFVLNCVHGKEGCYTYLKEIVNGESYITLGTEEQEALDKAKNIDNFME